MIVAKVSYWPHFLTLTKHWQGTRKQDNLVDNDLSGAYLNLDFTKFEWSEMTNDAIVSRSKNKTFFWCRHWVLQLTIKWSNSVPIKVQQRLTYLSRPHTLKHTQIDRCCIQDTALTTGLFWCFLWDKKQRTSHVTSSKYTVIPKWTVPGQFCNSSRTFHKFTEFHWPLSNFLIFQGFENKCYHLIQKLLTITVRQT